MASKVRRDRTAQTEIIINEEDIQRLHPRCPSEQRSALASRQRKGVRHARQRSTTARQQFNAHTTTAFAMPMFRLRRKVGPNAFPVQKLEWSANSIPLLQRFNECAICLDFVAILQSAYKVIIHVRVEGTNLLMRHVLLLRARHHSSALRRAQRSRVGTTLWSTPRSCQPFSQSWSSRACTSSVDGDSATCNVRECGLQRNGQSADRVRFSPHFLLSLKADVACNSLLNAAWALL